MRGLINKTKPLLIAAKDKGFYHLMSANFLIRFLGFSSQLVVAWILTPEDIGRIKVMQSFMSVFVVLAGFGFNESIIKLCSEKRPREEKFYLFKKGVLYSFIPQILTFSVILVLISNNLLSKDEVINRVFFIYAFGVFLLPMDSNFLSYLHALRRIKEYSIIQIITKIFGVALVVLLTYFFSIWGYAFAIISGYLITLIVIIVRNRKEFIQSSVTVPNPFKKHFNVAYLSTLTNLIGMILFSADIFIINYLSNDRTEVGYYAFATVFIGLLSIITRTVMQIAKPLFSEKSSDFRSWYDSYLKYNKIMILYLLAALLASLLFVTLFLFYAFNGKYENSIYYFFILAVAWFIRDINSLRGIALFGLGEIKANFFVSLVSILFTIPSVYFAFQIGGIKYVPLGMVLGSIFMLISSYSTFRFTINRHS